MKQILFFVVLSFNLSAQDITSTDQVHSGIVKPTVQKIVAPTLWDYADGMEGFDSYCIFKSSIDKNIYLLGFDEQGEVNLKLLIEQANYNFKLNQCTVIYNGTEIRLRQRLD